MGGLGFVGAAGAISDDGGGVVVAVAELDFVVAGSGDGASDDIADAFVDLQRIVRCRFCWNRRAFLWAI